MIRPVDTEISQRFGDNPTANILPGSPEYWIIEKFGNYQPDGHTGEDYAVPVGTPVRAVTDGTVLHIGWVAGTYANNPWWVAPGFAGYCAVIDHGSFIGIYGHCLDGSAGVAVGDRVVEGQVFIRSGNTGGSTGPHLHFEILPNGYVLGSKFYGRTDPETIFASLSYAGTIIPLTKGFLMALTDEEQAEILAHVRQSDTKADVLVQRTDDFAEVVGNVRKLVYGLSSLPAAVLNQGFTLPDGTVTNLAGILGAINAKPAGTTNVTGADPSVVVAAIKAQWAK